MNRANTTNWKRSSCHPPTRRDLIRGFVSAGFSIGVLGVSNVVAAKNTRTRKKPRRPRTTTVTRATRGLVTQTFLSGDPIAIPGEPGRTEGPAGPYPNSINVSGFANGVITDVDLFLLGVTHVAPEDIDMLLSKDDGRRALVMSDVGTNVPARDASLTLDDEATATLPQTKLTDGIFKPTDVSGPRLDPDTFAAPAPVPAPNTVLGLSAFDGANPNGTWRLFVMDDASGAVGELRGWGLRITAEVDTGTVLEQVSGSNGKRGKRNKKLKKGTPGK